MQTERIENHRAQFTIEIETDQLEDAKRKAARKISRQVSIKGFRKGKAPYRLVAQTVGEAAILEEALEALGDSLYKGALEESKVIPYGPGAFEDFKPEPAPTFVFSVPLQPEVDLKNYLDVRADFEEPTVSGDAVDEALKQLQLLAVEVVDEDVKVAAAGNRVNLHVESEFVDGDEPDADDADALGGDADPESDMGADAEDDVPESREIPPYIPKRGDTFVVEENAIIILDPNEDPFTHGFVEQLIGVETGSDVEFELTIPDDDADETIRNRQVNFMVTINGIEAIEIPELDDEFARQVCRNRGDEELDLEALRHSTREDLSRDALENAKFDYSGQILEMIVEGAKIDYPDLMLDEQIGEMIQEFEGNLLQQGMKLDDFLRLSNTSMDDLREQYRESAAQALQQSLVMRELVNHQEIEISDEDIELRLTLVVAGYGGGPEIRKLFDSPPMRDNFRNELMMSQITEHLVAIGRGEDAAEAIAALRGQMAADVERASKRSERLQQYEAEDAGAIPADGETDINELKPEPNEVSQPASDEITEDNATDPV